MLKCKKCSSEKTTKNGFVRKKQRFKCKDCGYNFIVGDKRTNHKVAVKKALCVLLYSTMKGAFNHLAKILDTSPSLVYRWIVEASNKIDFVETQGEIKEMEFDEMWHYINKKKKTLDCVAQVELSHGKSAVVILPHSDDFTKK